MASTRTWSLCLVSSGNTRKVVKVNPSSDKISDLFRIAGEAFGTCVESIKVGFPPQPLENTETLLSESKKVGNQERVHVSLSESSSSTNESTSKAKGKKGRPKKNAPKSNSKSAVKDDDDFNIDDDTKPEASIAATRTSSSRRPKRAAAQAATDSFADVIREQDRLMKAEKQPKKRTSTTTTSSKPNPKRATTFNSKEPGRRLGDGVVVGSPSKKARTGSSSTKKRSSTTSALFADQKKHEDMSTALLETLNQTSTAGSRLLRKTMKSAVENTYENSKAVARSAALESRDPPASVQMEKTDNNKLKVRFQKGVQGRGFYEDLVDWIPEEVLKEVLKAILKSNPENLRPQNLALLSPRFLWALAFRHWQEQEQNKNHADAPTPFRSFSVEEAYRQLLPDHKDWSFLRRRKQTLSAKAMENLRQEREAAEGSDGENFEEAAEAIQEVEQAMDQLQTFDRTQRAERVANAALARQRKQQQANSGDWKIVTPSEHDEDELMECISTSLKEGKDATKIAKVLGALDAAHNWRELANLEPSTLRAQVVEKETCLKYLTEQQVGAWVDHARLQTLEEIMVEIFDGSISHVQLLRDNTPTNTPKDLAAWIAMPDLLLEELGDAATGKLSEEDLGRFCNRASRAMQQFEWLQWYATAVE